MTNEYSDYLAHHGIKGQKWGVRRYQNKDGTLKNPRRQKPESSTWKSGDAGRLSDDELNRRNQRMQREQQYRQNVENTHPVRKEIKAAAKKILISSAVGVLTGIMVAHYKDGASFIGKMASYKLPTNAVRAAQAAKTAQDAAAAAKRAEELAKYASSVKR